MASLRPGGRREQGHDRDGGGGPAIECGGNDTLVYLGMHAVGTPTSPPQNRNICAPGGHRTLAPHRTRMAGTEWGDLDQNVFSGAWRTVVKAALRPPRPDGRFSPRERTARPGESLY